MTLEEIKKKICETIDENQEKIISIGKKIAEHPEMGYKEIITSGLVKNEFDKLKVGYEPNLAITGVKGKIYGKKSLANVCVIGEMDGIKCKGNITAGIDDVSHACGHNTQIAMMIGALIGLKLSDVICELDGDVTFFAVPAEEFVEMDYRNNLKKEGKIQGLGGKQELIRNGAFDDIDMSLMIHAKGSVKEPKLFVRGHNLGFVAKNIIYKGKAVHGSTPFDGINALNAAALSIIGFHSNRETFREEERIRIHPIITKGGDVVNSVPDEVIVETYVRGATFEAINKGNDAVNRSVAGACQMIGADFEIEDIVGYLPLEENDELSSIFEKNAEGIVGKENLVFGDEITGSSDIGDLSYLMPVIQPSIGGFVGDLHSTDFKVENENTAYIVSSKILAMTVAELLYNNAEKAIEIKNRFKPKFTKEEYIKHLTKKG